MRKHALTAALLLAALAVLAANAERSVEDIVAASRESIVVVTQYGREGKQNGIGAGFVVSKDGLVATCLHVIGEGRPIRVAFNGGREFDVIEVHASDRKLDLALVRIAATNLVPLKLGDSDALGQGASVVAIGNPLGFEHSVVTGVVSARREIQGNQMIQVAIPIEPGNSGGPLLDSRGRVEGVLMLKDAFADNLGFAMPVNALKKLLDQPNPVPIQAWARFSSLDPAEWAPLMGAQWRRKSGAIHVEGAGSGFGGRSLCLSQQPAPVAPYEVAATVRMDDEAGAAGLAFGSDGDNRHYGFYPTASQVRLTRFDGPNVFSWTILKELKTPHYRPGEWNILKVRVETNRILGFVNGQKVMDVPETVPIGKAGLVKFRQTTADFRRFAIARSIIDRSPSQSLAAAVQHAVQADRVSPNEHNLLAAEPDASRPLLLQEARAFEAKAARLRLLSTAVSAEATRRKLAAVCDAPDAAGDIFDAALLISRLDDPDLEVAPYRAELDRMAEILRRTVAGQATDTAKLDALTRFLFNEQGFHGSRTDFYNRANSYINDVLDDREGLPITLAILYIELARATGIRDIYGIPMPTRFMVKHAPAGSAERIIDVFEGGKVLTRTQAIELVADDADAISEEAFRPASKRAIVIRMLRNLLGIAQRNSSTTDTLRYLDTILDLAPNSAPDRLTRAQIRAQQGDTAAAKDDVRWLLDHDTPGFDTEKLAEWYKHL